MGAPFCDLVFLSRLEVLFFPYTSFNNLKSASLARVLFVMPELTSEEAYDYDRVWRYIANDIRLHQEILEQGVRGCGKRFFTVTKQNQPELHQALEKEESTEWHSSTPDLTYDPQHPWQLELTRGKQHSTWFNALQSFTAYAREVYIAHLSKTNDDVDLEAMSKTFHHFEVEMQGTDVVRRSCRCFVIDTHTSHVSELAMFITLRKGVALNYTGTFMSVVHTFDIRENCRAQSVDEIMMKIFGQ